MDHSRSKREIGTRKIQTYNIGVVFRPFRMSTNTVKSHLESGAEDSFGTRQSAQRGYTTERGQGRAVN